MLVKSHSHLTRMLVHAQMFKFAVFEQKAIKGPEDLESVSRLVSLGMQNIAVSPENGLDYEKLIGHNKFG